MEIGIEKKIRGNGGEIKDIWGRGGKMAQWIRRFAMQAWQTVLQPRNLYKIERRALTLPCCSLTSTRTS